MAAGLQFGSFGADSILTMYNRRRPLCLPCRKDSGHAEHSHVLFREGRRTKTEGSTPMANPARPIDAYKALIDQLVNETSHSVAAKIVAERGTFLETSARAAFK
jgi:hypothetical protein